jgi:TBC1 domain family protein 5
MLLRIRWHLLDADYNNALGLLLRYPELDKDLPAQTLALDALYLRSHMNNEGASYLVLKYTGRPLISDRPTTPPALQRNITTFSGINATRHAGRNSLSPPRATKQSRNIEGILQSTAKNIYARGEKLGINKVSMVVGVV